MAPKAAGEEKEHADGPSTSVQVNANTGQSYWLMKTEPSVFSWDNLAASPNQTTSWEGVRNPQARNHMRAMQLGDEAFFYHSNCKTPTIMGIAKVVKTAYPDHSAWDKKSEYFDASCTPEKPKWWMVDVQLVRELTQPVSLDMIKWAAAGAPFGEPAAKKQKKGDGKGGASKSSEAQAQGTSGDRSGSVLSSMELLNRPRLSVQRVTPQQWQAILHMEKP